MEWCKLYARMPGDKAILEAGEKAAWLFVVGLCYCAQEESDGFIPSAQLPRFGLSGAADRARRLVDNGLWTVVPGGWHVTRWLERQEPSSKLKESRARAAERQRRHRERNAVTDSVTPPVTNGVTPAVTNGVSHATKSREELPSEASLPRAQSTINTQSAVGAWVDAYAAAVGRKPTAAMKSQAGREIRTLLEASSDPGLVLEAAKAAGRKGFPTVEREYAPMAARRTKAEAELDVDAILGPDTRSLPTPPLEVDEDPVKRREWYERHANQRQQERLTEARTILARSQ